MSHSHAQIVATLGPASKNRNIIERMINHQMDVVRLNFSWGTYEEHARYIKTVHDVAQTLNKTIPIIQDLSGPRIQQEDGHHFDTSETSVITEKDKKDLAFGLEQAVDYVALSYVGSADDVRELKQLITDEGKQTPVIAKIERAEALKNLTGIVSEADAIMVARGDLGNTIPLEKIPWVEKEIITSCKKAGKPVITATQMLLSMTENPSPTRAEVTDVFFAIMNGSDAVMLSEESASGKYPVESVAMMERIVQEAEHHHDGTTNLL